MLAEEAGNFMKAEIVSISSHRPHESYYYHDEFLNSIKRVGAEVTVLGMGEPWRGLMTKPNIVRQWLRDGKNKTDIVFFVDAWDIIFQKHPDEILDEYFHLVGPVDKGVDLPLIFNAERNCFPGGDHCNAFPESGTPWRYLNSGFIVGPVCHMLALLESMDLESLGYDEQRPDGSWNHPNDQLEYLKAFVKQPVPMVLDTEAKLCISLHDTKPEELEFFEQGGKKMVRNLVTGTVPGVLHGNGNGKNNTLPLIINHLGL